jgi:signal transduction histidine kinase
MLRVICLIVFFGGLCAEVFAQNTLGKTSIDNLLKKLENNPQPDTNQVNLLNQIAYEYRNIAYEQTLLYAQKALQLASRLQYKPGEIEANRQMGIGFIVNNENFKALQAFMAGLKTAQEVNDIKAMATLKGNIGRVYIANSNFSEAYAQFEDALKLTEKLNNLPKLLTCYINLGEVNFHLNKFEESINYLTKALLLNEGKLKDSSSLVIIHRLMGENYFKQEKYKEASSFFNTAIKISKAKNNRRELCLAYNALAKTTFKIKNWQETELLALQALEIAQGIFYKSGIIEAETILAEVYGSLKQYEKAYFYQRRYKLLNDSLLSERNNNQLLSYQLLYETEKKQLEIENLKQARENQRITLYFLIIIVVLIIGLAWLFWRSNVQRKEANVILVQQKQAIENQAYNLQNLNQEIKTKNIELTRMNEILSERVYERTARLRKLNDKLVLANRELDSFIYRASHDFRSPIVTLLGLLNITKNEDNIDNLKHLLHLIEGVVNKADSMLYKMLYINLINKRAIKSHLQHIDFSKIFQKVEKKLSVIDKYQYVQFEYDFASQLQFVSDEELIFIIIENIFENAIHFSANPQEHSPKIHIKLMEAPQGIHIEVIDNGQGIEFEHLDKIFTIFFRGSTDSKGNGLGLYVVKKAVEKLGGKIDIKSKVDEFTKVSIFLPDKKNLLPIQPIEESEVVVVSRS